MSKTKNLLILIVLYLPLLFLVNYIYFKLSEPNVVFYDSLIACTILSCAVAIILLKLKPFKVFCLFDKSLIFIILLLLGYIYSLSIPTVIDRSLTLYLLESLDESPNGISLDQMKEDLTLKYIDKYQLISTRINEQLVSGTILIDKSGRVILSDKGRLIATFSKFYRAKFLPKHDFDDQSSHTNKDCKQAMYECR